MPIRFVDERRLREKDPDSSRTVRNRAPKEEYPDEAARQDVPARYFLDESNRKYPFRNRDGTYNCRMLKSAIRLAGMHGDDEVQSRAQRFHERICQADEDDGGA